MFHWPNSNRHPLLSGLFVYFYVQAKIGCPFVWVMVGLAIALTGNLGAFPAMRFFGRRPLLLVCSVISALTMFGMGIAHDKGTSFEPKTGKALVALSITFTWVYGIWPGPGVVGYHFGDTISTASIPDCWHCKRTQLRLWVALFHSAHHISSTQRP